MKTTNVMLTDLTQREMLEVNGGGKITIILKYGKILLREAAIQLGFDNCSVPFAKCLTETL